MAAAGALLLGTVLAVGAFFAFRSDHGGRGTVPLGSPTPGMTPTPAASPTPTPTGAPSPPATPTAAAGALHFNLGMWAKGGGWVFDGTARGASGYREGEAIPFLVRIDGARPGDVYGVGLRYDCRSGQAAAFDYLTSYDRDAGSAPALADDGPARLPPDAAIAVPDDGSTAFDDAEERQLALWGATLEVAPVGRGLEAPCAGSKTVQVAVRARAGTVFILWGAHLASEKDWGGGQGASRGDHPFSMTVQVSGVPPDQQTVAVDPAALLR
ncbi:MAG TPA: hypothetical protein VFT91_09555 [Dehalococcoidia bacterium]|nr:hypothetical protein [Dehalococcoidia bacterium]